MYLSRKPFRVQRVRDGLFYQGPMHKNVFVKLGGKRFKTIQQAQKLIDAYNDYKAADNGPLTIVQDFDPT